MDNNLTCLVVARYEYRAGVPRLKVGGKEYTVADSAAVTRNGDVLEGLTAESELLKEDGTRVALGSLLGSWNAVVESRILVVGLNDGAEGHYEIGVEDYITLPFTTAEPIYLRLGDWADLTPVMDEGTAGQFGKRYEVCDFPKPELNTSTGGYDYELRLDAYYMKWKNKMFRYIAQAVSLGEEAQGEASWSLTATLDVHLEVLLRNLTALGYTYGGEAFAYGIDWDRADTEARYISYSGVNIFDALSLMADSFHCEWWMEDNRIRFGRLEHSDLVQVRAGVEAETIKRTDSAGAYATRIYAFGAERNLQSDYRSTADEVTVGGVVQRRLMLPEDVPYVDAWRYDASGNKVYTTGYKTAEDGSKVYIGDTGYGDLEGEVTLCGYRVTQGTDSDGNVTLTKEYVTEEEYAALTPMAVTEAVEAVVTAEDIYPRTADEVKAVSVYWKMFDRSDESDQGTLVYDDIDPVYKDTTFDPDTYIAERYPDSNTL
ncbi:MAG: hypothetical protein LUC33_02460, partial [Prevotellaceae bacterium]|nr:hypothetical protein [Prevotellaceae bacterium]